MSQPVKHALEAAADARLTELARQSELFITRVRFVGWTSLAVVLIVLELMGRHPFGPESPRWHRWDELLMCSFAAAALALWLAVRRDWCPPWLPIAGLLGDGLSYGLALAVWRLDFGAAVFRRADIMTAVTFVCVSIGLNGAMRFQVLAARLGSLIAILLFAMAAVWADFSVTMQIYLVSALAAFGIRNSRLARIVASSVRGEVARTTLSRFLPAAVLDSAHSDLAALTQPRVCTATILMSDLRGFSGWAEHRPPAEVLTFVSRVQGELAAAVAAEHGHVDKFLGDGMLAVFGVLEGGDDHAARAVRCAADMQRRVAALAVKLGIGVHSGPVIAGCIGSGERLEYTVLGDTVNTASRLQAHTKEAGVAVLISGETATLACATGLRACGSTLLRGREQAVQLYTFEGEAVPELVTSG